MCTGCDSHCSVGGRKQKFGFWRVLNSEYTTSCQKYIKSKGGKMANEFSNPKVQRYLPGEG
jgi:hypothetical protein